jgi:hypothetical protein
MARKPSDIVQPNLRIREDLRRQLEKAAKKRLVSLNYEMTARLKESFDREALVTLGGITEDMKIQWARWSVALFDKEQSADLLRATEALIALLEQSPDRGVKEAVAQVGKAITAIKRHAEASARGTAGGNK